jgi:hypothetical protein
MTMDAPVPSGRKLALSPSMPAPFLLAIAPVLYHWGRNFGDSQFVAAAALLVAALAIAGVILGALVPVIPERNARAAGASLIVLFLLFYGYAFNALWKRLSLPRPWILHLALGVVLIAVAVGAILLLRRGRWDLTRAMKAVTLAFGLVCALSGYQVVRGAIRARESLSEAWKFAHSKSRDPIPSTPAADGVTKPDIYYIILDGYAREDVLREYYKFDNSAFTEALRQRGFFVADRSCANYPFTMLSLASSLNMTYLEGIGHHVKTFDSNRRAIYAMTQGNRVSRFLKTQGYRYVTNLTHFKATETSETADVAYAPTPLWIRGEFVDSLTANTIACLFRPSRVDYHLHALDSIREAALLDGPKFVFWHIILPHPPYIFDRHGNVTQAAYSGSSLETDDDRKQPYLEQVQFLNPRVLGFLDHILKTSRTPPVIVVQSDHGPPVEEIRETKDRKRQAWLPAAPERMPILNAYHVPDSVRKKLYPSITPVNTFRVLLSELFGAELPTVEERSYYGRVDRGVELMDVTDTVLPRKEK